MKHLRKVIIKIIIIIAKFAKRNFWKIKALIFLLWVILIYMINKFLGKEKYKTLTKFSNEQTRLKSFIFLCHEHKNIYCLQKYE